MTKAREMASRLGREDFESPLFEAFEAASSKGGVESPKPEGFIVAAVMLIIASIVIGGITGVCGLSALLFLGAIACIVLFFVTREKVVKEAEERAAAAEEAEERFKDEIAMAVQERLKGTIRVRCRYCGSLNDEDAIKCDSCGATL
jgi:rubrerythrin